MAVSVLGNDPNHAALHASTAAAQTVVNGLPASSSLAVITASKALLAAQISEVVYCLGTGRLNPATILSTLS
jgi:hypothetical protein